MCSTDDHHKGVALAANIPQHLQNCSSFRRKAEGLPNLLPPELQHRQNIMHFPSPPWQHSATHEWQIITTVPGITGRSDDTNLKCQCSLTNIDSYQTDYVIYTDGSASRGTRNRGAAAVVTRQSPLWPQLITTIKTKGRTFTSSYEEEAAAMESALSRISTNANHPSIFVLFCTECKSLCQAFIWSNPQTFSIHNSICSISSFIFIQLIPGHSAIPGNDLVDKAAKQATTITTDTIHPVSFSSSIQVIKETVHDALPSHERFALIYHHWKDFRDAKEISNRKDDVLLACLRSSHHPSLGQYLNRTDPSQVQSTQTATSKYKISFTGSENVLLWWPLDRECLGTTNSP